MASKQRQLTVKITRNHHDDAKNLVNICELGECMCDKCKSMANADDDYYGNLPEAIPDEILKTKSIKIIRRNDDDDAVMLKDIKTISDVILSGIRTIIFSNIVRLLTREDLKFLQENLKSFTVTNVWGTYVVKFNLMYNHLVKNQYLSISYKRSQNVFERTFSTICWYEGNATTDKYKFFKLFDRTSTFRTKNLRYVQMEEDILYLMKNPSYLYFILLR